MAKNDVVVAAPQLELGVHQLRFDVGLLFPVVLEVLELSNEASDPLREIGDL